MTKAITKNSKKGFTLVELVIVIAILAILAAIAIPVVNSIINTASKNGAISNAETIELAIKECQADIAAKNDEVYDGTTANTLVASRNLPSAANDHANIQVIDVASAKAIAEAFEVVTYNGDDYAPYWDTTNDNCVFLAVTANNVTAGDSLETGAAYPGFGTTTVVALTNAPVADGGTFAIGTTTVDSL